MSLAIDIVRKYDEFGLADVIETYSKEDIETAIKSEKNDDLKSKLKVLSTNWNAAEKALGAIKALVEIVSDGVEVEEDIEDSLMENEDEDFWSYDDDLEEDYDY